MFGFCCCWVSRFIVGACALPGGGQFDCQERCQEKQGCLLASRHISFGFRRIQVGSRFRVHRGSMVELRRPIHSPFEQVVLSAT